MYISITFYSDKHESINTNLGSCVVKYVKTFCLNFDKLHHKSGMKENEIEHASGNRGQSNDIG